MGLSAITDGTILEWASRFVSQPSEQSAAMERDPAVIGFISEVVLPLVRALGLPGSIDQGGNLHVVVGPPAAPIELVLVTYAMTHPRSTMEDPFSGRVVMRDGIAVIRGRGASEQKGAMAAALAAFVDVAFDVPLGGRLAFLVLTAGETGRHDAIAQAWAAMETPPRRAILAVGTGGEVSLGNRGRLDIEVTIRGRAAHSSTPWAGCDVTLGVRSVLNVAATLSAGLVGNSDLGPATLTCTSIVTRPDATHTVQSDARMVFDRRLLPTEDAEAVFDEIATAFRESCPLEIETRKGPFMQGALLDRRSAFVESIERSVTSAGEPVPYFGHSFGALDAGYLSRLGVETVMWGPGDPAMFHTPEEHVSAEELFAAARAYRAVLIGAAARG